MKNKGKLHFNNIQDWFNWEEKELVHFIREKYLSKPKEPIFTDKKMGIFKIPF